jgi:hypothetical protein
MPQKKAKKRKLNKNIPISLRKAMAEPRVAKSAGIAMKAIREKAQVTPDLS